MLFPFVCPPRRVVGDIPPDVAEAACVADDVFVEPALPEGMARRAAMRVEEARDGGFERPHDGGQRRRFDPAVAVWCGGAARCAPTTGTMAAVLHDPHDAVEMVRHDHERVQPDVRARRCCLVPFHLHDAPGLCQVHHAVPDFPEQRQPIPRADGHEIRAGRAVIEKGQANRATVVRHGGIFRHKTQALLGYILLLVAACTAQAQTRVLDDFADISAWQTATAEGVSLTISKDDGALRMDYDFGSGGGYAIARRDLPLALPDHYRFTYRLRADSAHINDLEFKLVDPSGESVWWHNRRRFRYPAQWQTLVTRPRHLEFAWGPAGGGAMQEVGAAEFVVTAVEGGKGTVWLDDFTFEVLPPPGPPQRPRVTASAGRPIATRDGLSGWSVEAGAHAITLDFGAAREFGGIVLEWDLPPRPPDVDCRAQPCFTLPNPDPQAAMATTSPLRARAHYRLLRSDDGQRWDVLVDTRFPATRQTFYLPEREARYLRLDVATPVPVRLAHLDVLPPGVSASPNAFFAYLAAHAPQGAFPPYFDSTQVYWTVAGEAGAMEELLVGQTGAVELRRGAFSLEPFWKHGGRVQTWADAAHKQHLVDDYAPIPVVTRQHPDSTTLEITAWAHGGTGFVRYVAHNPTGAPRDDTLLVLLRPFQVNPPWQFLNQVGGVGSVEVEDNSAPSRYRIAGFRGTLDSWPVTSFVRQCNYAAAGHGVLTAWDELAGTCGLLAGTPDESWNEYAFTYPLRLAPGGRDTLYFALPMEADAVTSRMPQHAAAALDSARAFWQQRLERVQLRVPGSDLVETMRANLAYVLVNKDGPSIQPGSRSYDRSWIRDGSLTSAALLRLGLWDEVRTFLEWYAPYQYASGSVPCCVGRLGADSVPEHDSHGQLVYGIAEYVRFTQDTTFARRMWPHVERALAYMDTLRATHRTPAYTRDTLRAYYDLLPASISHEGYSVRPMHSFWDYSFALKGYKDAAYLAHLLDLPDAADYAARADTFRATLQRAYRLAMEKENITYLPGSVELGDFDATSTTTLVSPAGEAAMLPGALDATFDRYMDYFRQRRDGEIAWDAYTPYEWRVAGTLVRLGRVDDAHALFDYFFGHRRPIEWRHWAEVVWRDASAPRFIGDMPHTWVGSDFIRSALDLFAYEDEAADALVVGAGLKAGWLEAPGGVAIEGLNTWYGPLTYTAARTGDALVFTFAPGLRLPPGGLVLRPVYGAPRRVLADGQPVALAPDGTVHLTTLPARVELFY